MGLFSTLTSSASGSTGTPTTSADLPTVVQLYTAAPIQLDDTAVVSKYTAMTYQAVQVRAFNEELKNKHQNPDLGVWNCLVPSSSAAAASGIEHLLPKIVPNARTFVWTVDFSKGTDEDFAAVEPSMAKIQEAMIRHFIENPPAEETKEEIEESKTQTTSLFDLKDNQFGLAPEDKGTTRSSKESESDKEIKFALMICAVLPPKPGEDAPEIPYRTKQAKQLIIYHLRRFAARINATLCFVTPTSESETLPSVDPAEGGAANAGADESTAVEQPGVTLDKLGEVWKDFALDQAVWEQSSSSSAASEVQEDLLVSTSIYGPGKHGEELIESVILRNAHCPAYWDASKDSLWVALPAPEEKKEKEEKFQTGDQGWLKQLRDSIASAIDQPKPDATPQKAAEKPKEADAAVSSFFENLLKNP